MYIGYVYFFVKIKTANSRIALVKLKKNNELL